MADPIGNIRFSRMVRTANSEKYSILGSDDEIIGVLDVHYSGMAGTDYIHGSVILLGDLEQEEEEQVVELINEEIVQSFAPDWARAEFVLEVYVGRRISTYSDAEEFAEEDIGNILDDEEF
jgi:hypothetical protein